MIPHWTLNRQCALGSHQAVGIPTCDLQLSLFRSPNLACGAVMLSAGPDTLYLSPRRGILLPHQNRQGTFVT